ncbi:MAG: alpha/beta fold hydrolase [Nannocystaceae bacterium]
MPETLEIEDVVTGARGGVRVERRGPKETASAPPMVILGGMTQTLASWGGQLRALAKTREVLVYETRGQGTTSLGLGDVRPPVHVADFCAVMAACGWAETPVDLCGFSFGGRMALAIAAAQSHQLRRLVVTGVSAGRGALGRAIVAAWRAALQTGSLETLAWVSLPDILGPGYLGRNEKLIPAMIKATVSRNSFAGVKALFDQAMGPSASSDKAWPWDPVVLAAQIHTPTLVIGGELDRLAPAEDLHALASSFAGPATVEVISGVGHTVAIEAPAAWREPVLSFLSQASGAAP